MAPILEHLESRVLLSADVIDVSGGWLAHETVSRTLSVHGLGRQHGTESGTGFVEVFQDGTHVWYERKVPGDGSFIRDGSISGSLLSLTGDFVVLLVPDIEVDQNSCTISGVVAPDVQSILLTGKGYASGYWDGMAWVATGRSTAEFIRPQLVVDLLAARMIGPSRLGLSLSISVPKYYDAAGTELTLQLEWNGQVLQKEIDVSDVVRAGRRIVLKGMSKRADRRWSIDLSDPNEDGDDSDALDRFTDDATLTLTAEVSSSEPGWIPGQDVEDDVRVPLPVVFVHGYTGPPGFGRWLSTPLYNLALTAQSSGLAKMLAKATSNEPFWTPYSASARSGYQTYWFGRYNDLTGAPADVASRLNSYILQAEEATYGDSVNLITHSTGGLVSQYYLATQAEPDVNKLIMVASPNWGVSLSYLSTSGMDRQRVDELTQNTLGGFLVPRPGSDASISRPSVFEDGHPVSLLTSTFSPYSGPISGIVEVTNIYAAPATPNTPWDLDAVFDAGRNWYSFTSRNLAIGDGVVAAEDARLTYAGVAECPINTLTVHRKLLADRLVDEAILEALGVN